MDRHQIFTRGIRNACMTAAIGLLLGTSQGFSQEAVENVLSGVIFPLQHRLDVKTLSTRADADPVDKQLARYSEKVPEMAILRLHGDQTAAVIRQLPALLGEGAANMDYEHDADVRTSLMEMQMYRIGIMAREGLPSATLFKVGKGAAFYRPYLCVITLDTRPFRQDAHYASRFLTSGHGNEYPVFGDVVLVENEDFLSFAVDHEVFHCLDAYFNGPPIKKTYDEIYSHYQLYMNEARADAFASEVFKGKSADPSLFLSKFASLRSLSLLGLDLQHFTGDVIRRSMSVPPVLLQRDLEQLVAASRALVAEVAPSAGRYGVRVVSIARLVDNLGGDSSNLLLEFEGQELPSHDESQVAALLHEVRQAQRILEEKSILSMPPRRDLMQRTVSELGHTDVPLTQPSIDTEVANP